MFMGLTGQSFTSSVGSLSPADVMGLTGQSATASVAGFGSATGLEFKHIQTLTQVQIFHILMLQQDQI